MLTEVSIGGRVVVHTDTGLFVTIQLFWLVIKLLRHVGLISFRLAMRMWFGRSPLFVLIFSFLSLGIMSQPRTIVSRGSCELLEPSHRRNWGGRGEAFGSIIR